MKQNKKFSTRFQSRIPFRVNPFILAREAKCSYKIRKTDKTNMSIVCTTAANFESIATNVRETLLPKLSCVILVKIFIRQHFLL